MKAFLLVYIIQKWDMLCELSLRLSLVLFSGEGRLKNARVRLHRKERVCGFLTVADSDSRKP